MHIKASKQPQPQKVHSHSFQQLKKQCTSLPLKQPPNLSNLHHQHNTNYHQYLQVNYLKDYMYKISPALHSKVPLLKQQQNLRDYLLEVQNDNQKQQQVNNQLKRKYFMNQYKPNKSSRLTSRKSKKSPENHKKNHSKHQSIIQLFDPIEYLQDKKNNKKNKIADKIKKLQNVTMFCQNVDSVKFLSQAPHIQIPQPLPTLNKKTSNSLGTSNNKLLQKTNKQINSSLCQLLQRSAKYQSPSKNGPSKIKHYKSRNQLKKANDKKIKTQRDKIMSMISRDTPASSHTRRLSAMSLSQIPPKQKYAIDYISYLRTKTKDQLDKYIYQKLIKRPQKDLQKFQQVILKQVKFENQENKHKIERFFIKMRQEFRRVQKYNKQGSKFDWRSKSMHLDEMKKQDQNLQVTKLFEQKVISTTDPIIKNGSKKFKSARQRFLRVQNLQRKDMKLQNIEFISRKQRQIDEQGDKQQLRQQQINRQSNQKQG